MGIIRIIMGRLNQYGKCTRMHSTTIPNSQSISGEQHFETVFNFPFIKYIALINRLKTYQIVGTGLAIPSCGVLELLNVMPSQAFLTAGYIGLTGTGVLSLFSLPFQNTIGFLYISKDNQQIKISSVNFWGKRVDRVVPADDWTPLLDMPQKTTDMIFLTPKLSDNTTYKWFVKFGNVLNAKKIGEVLE